MSSSELNKGSLRELLQHEEILQEHLVRSFQVREVIVSGFVNLRTVNLTSKSKKIAEDRKYTNTWNW